MKKSKIIKKHKLNRRDYDPLILVSKNLKIEYTKIEERDTKPLSDCNMFDRGIRESILSKYYKQIWVSLEEILKVPVCYCREAVLKPNSKVPLHIDDPFKLRLLYIKKGTHTYIYKKNRVEHKVKMQEGDLFVVNPSFWHRIENNSNNDRIALLCDIYHKDLERLLKNANI